jgi:tRNA nucleotidyltransferase (CCA-adding enzyme)
MIDHLLKALRDQDQVGLFHLLVNNLSHRTINGHAVGLCRLELDKQIPGLAAVVEKAFEVENAEALFVIFSFAKQHRSLMVARSGKESIRLDRLLAPFGGGGHTHAASALLKDRHAAMDLSSLHAYLEEVLAPAVTASGIMSPVVSTIHRDWSLLDTSLHLERVDHTGAPVLNADGDLVGFLTLRDIMKGRKAGQMHAPVHAYMTKNLVTAKADATVTEIEKLLFDNNIGHLPVIDDRGLAGIITRTDLLRFMKSSGRRNRRALQKMEAV